MSGANGIRTGVVKFFNDKGFGFIVPDGDGAEIFFHVSQIQGDEEPNAKDRVSFTLGTGKGGRPCACEVKIIG